MYDLVILYSGGADSRLMLEMALGRGRRPFCILINYEQLHIEELGFAERQLNKLGVPYRIISIRNLEINSGLTGDGIKNDSGEVHEMHVSSRNLMFVGVAASIAENLKIGEIWYGANHEDLVNKFPDCMPNWIKIMNLLLEINGPKSIKLKAPLLEYSETKINELLGEYGINKVELFSGYGDL